jgi:hypothetical protein
LRFFVVFGVETTEEIISSIIKTLSSVIKTLPSIITDVVWVINHSAFISKTGLRVNSASELIINLPWFLIPARAFIRSAAVAVFTGGRRVAGKQRFIDRSFWFYTFCHAHPKTCGLTVSGAGVKKKQPVKVTN